MFREQVRVSQELFESLREQMILQVSKAIQPLVTFLKHHDCDEDEILAAIFEAIAYEKNAELELGVLAFDKQREWSEQTDQAVATRFSELLNRIGLEMFHDFQNHRLYQHGFLPYQYRRMHGQDVLVDRLGVPEILHREQKNWEDGLVWKMRGKDGSVAFFPAEHARPRGTLINMDFYQQLYSIPIKGPGFMEHQPIAHRTAGIYEIGKLKPENASLGMPAHEYLCGFARAFKRFHESQAAADAIRKTTVTTPDSEVSVKPPVDESAIDAWEKEIKQMFAGMFRTDSDIQKTVQESLDKRIDPETMVKPFQEAQRAVDERREREKANGDWSKEEKQDFQTIQEHYARRAAEENKNDAPAPARDSSSS
jgi:hypothetical protein